MNKMLKSCVYAILFAVSLAAQAADPDKVCPQFFFHGAPVHAVPSINNESQFICKKSFSVQYYVGTKTPLWSAEKLEAAATQGDEARTDEFLQDPEVPSRFMSTNADYKALNKGLIARFKTLEDKGLAANKYLYDRGHMSPAGDFSNDKASMAESFFLSNMVPQVNSHNQGIWKDLEIQVRQWARSRGTLFIVTGPIYRDGKALEKLNGLAVPTDIYKVVVDPKTNESIAFVIPNLPIRYAKGSKGGFNHAYEYENNIYRLNDFVVSIRDVEKLTNLNFHPFLTQASSDQFETRRSAMWGR